MGGLYGTVGQLCGNREHVLCSGAKTSTTMTGGWSISASMPHTCRRCASPGRRYGRPGPHPPLVSPVCGIDATLVMDPTKNRTRQRSGRSGRSISGHHLCWNRRWRGCDWRPDPDADCGGGCALRLRRGATRIRCRARGRFRCPPWPTDAGWLRRGDAHLGVPTDKGAYAGAKFSALVAGWSRADSIDDMALSRHGAMRAAFDGGYAPRRTGCFCGSPPSAMSVNSTPWPPAC